MSAYAFKDVAYPEVNGDERDDHMPPVECDESPESDEDRETVYEYYRDGGMWHVTSDGVLLARVRHESTAFETMRYLRGERSTLPTDTEIQVAA